MPKLYIKDQTIEISQRQWEALVTLWPTLKDDQKIKINGIEYLRGDINGLDITNEPPTPAFVSTLPPRQINKLPRGIVLPDRLQTLFDAGENIDWYFHTKRKK
jgi:hypothetical protein